MARAKGGLGKGLEALFVDNNTSDIPTTSLKLTEIEPNKEQPRKHWLQTWLTPAGNMGCSSLSWCGQWLTDGTRLSRGNAAGGHPVWWGWQRFQW